MAVLTSPRTQTPPLPVLNSGARSTSGVETLEVISPELALVDPELATRARASLRTYGGDELVDALQPAPLADEIAPEPSADEETVLSPELALVDPVLAAWARTRLPDLSHVAPVVRKQPAPGPSPEDVQADGSAPRRAYAEGTLSPRRDEARETTERLANIERRQPRHMASVRRATLVAAAVVLVAAGVLVGDVIRQQGRTVPAAFNFTVQTAADAPPATSTKAAAGSSTRGKPPGPRSARQKGTDASDAANRAETRSARPHAADPAKRHPSPTSVGSTRSFVWVPVAATSAYDVAFYRAGRRVLAARTKHAKLTVAKSWIYSGRRERFAPGVYRWYVWPIYKSGSGVRGTPIVNSELIVSG
jgi:hypothetical protein